jgi:thioesterase domain-containing protein
LIAAQSSSRKSHRLRYVIFGGEALDSAMLKPWYADDRNAGTQMVNMYGITETTVHVTCRPLERADAEKPAGSPIGRCIPDLKIYVLDGQGRLAPAGVTGELYVAGAGVARGYFHLSALTAKRFVPDPFSGQSGSRMYKTGDMGRWLTDGTLEYLGRNDFQVKIRGYRIELGEIETQLREYPGVGEAVVIAREDTPGDKRLIAYYTRTSGEDGTSPARLRLHVAERLPEYMLPAAFVEVDALPLTVNGKLDRAALPQPESSRGPGNYLAPLTATEKILCEIWAQVLKVDKVGLNDNFFSLGGHSLLAITLGTRVRERFGQALPLAVFFDRPTVAALAACLDFPDVERDGALVPLRSGSGPLPLFLVHAGNGGLMGYRKLIRALRTDGPVYGLERPGFQSGPVEPLDIEQLAQRYLEPLRRRQPRGPYALAGWSFGGLVAFEMARQLESAGERVGLLGLIDTRPPYRRMASRFLSLADRIGLVHNDLLDHEIRALGVSANPVFIERLQSVLEAHTSAMQRYSPDSGTAAERVIFIRAAGEEEKDYVAAWQALSRNPVEQHPVPGNHYSIMELPGVAQIADALGKALSDVSALRRHGMHQ